ncbi:MAG TPA: aromatic ring-hydroxylating dioxygenase subunit alpha [Steroidobacteraceae bacterium]|nr:aromatic ring-hydroxylating dioxygenase subunit alpha [Steroidobacteraceae bacterium]
MMYDKKRILDLLAQAQPGHTLPQPFYRDPDIYEFDVSAVFGRSWLMLGFEAELAEPGSYFSLTIGGNPILVVRGRDGAIRGFHNICRHRGAQICAEGSGKLSRIVCPYHKWTYELDGQLVGAARAPEGLHFEEHSLVPIRIERLEGCIYGALTDGAPEFSPFRDAAAPFLNPYRLGSAKLAYQSVLLEKANWKLVMENARECYHCAAWHPELKVSFPIAFNAGFRVTDGSRNAAYVAKMQELGFPVGPATGLWWHVGRYPLNPGVETVSADGRPLVAQRLLRTNSSEIGGLRWATEPNSFCHAFADYAFMFTALPAGPGETRVVCKWLVPKEAREGVDFRIPELTEVWAATNLQDRELAENNQRGIGGIGYRPGPYAEGAEELVVRFNHWYRETAASAAAAGE